MNVRTAGAMLLLPCCSCMFAAVPKAGADFYRSRDGSGAVCITDKLQSVPAQYRAGMQVAKDDAGAPTK